jgi:hypothetical protein
VIRTFVGKPYVPQHVRQGHRALFNLSGMLRTTSRMRLLRSKTLWAGALVLILPGLAAAQTISVQPRIAAAQIDDSRLTVLRGNTHPLARAQYDQGKTDPALNLERITMMFQPTAAQQADLDALLASQQNPTSANFHKWLTPAQYGDRFGIAQADLDKATAWLQGHGFIVVETPPSRNLVVFNGTAAQVESAFRTEIHNYATRDRKFYANSAEPSVPSALAGVVSGFRGLNNFQLKPRSIKKSTLSGTPEPNFTSSISGNHFVAPGDFAMIYDLNPLYSAGTPIDGTGQKIVIVGQSNIVLSDIAKFRSLSNLSVNPPQEVLVPTSLQPGVIDGDVQEASLDIEWAGAVAPEATIVYVYSTNVFTSLQYAIENDLAPVIGISYGVCEPQTAASDINFLVALAQQANALGITIVSSVGDGGATDCDGDLGNFPAELGLNVDVPGSLPYVTGVGGTEFNEGSGTFWLAQSSTDIITSALSYIPEKTWNDTNSIDGLLSGGGGASSIFGKPSWQTGTGVPADGVRDVPDVSVNASTGHDSYLICSQVSGTIPLVSGCQNGFRISSTNTNLQAYGGTSFGAPTFAGIVALINQKTGSTGQGNLNYILYPLAAIAPTAFHDITTGDNTSPCISGTQDCPNGNPIGFTTGLGYDQATGLGSIDAAILVNAWSSISTGAGSTPTLSSISPTSTTAGSVDFTLMATGTNFTTNAQILWNGSTAGVTMLTVGPPNSITATISHTLVAYGTTASITVTDDGTKAGESSAKTFTVNGAPPANDNIANAITIASSNFTGTVDNSAATTEMTDPTPPCALTAPFPSTSPRTKTVWWSLTPVASGSFIVSTIGSVYDTTLSVWTVIQGSLTNVACNDDVSGGQYTQSLLSFSATAGTKYYIMVAPFGPPDSLADQAGGKTVLNVSPGTLPALSASPSSQTVAAASSATYMITNSGSVSYTLTCSGLPTGASCGAVTVAANSTASLVIATTSRTAGVPPLLTKRYFHIDLWSGTLSVLGIMVLTLLAMRRRRGLSLIPLGTAALFLVFLAAGCGGYGGGGNTNPYGTPAGTYTITVTGTSGASTLSTTVTLKVT